MILNKLFKERLPDGSIRHVGGLLKHEKDERDFKYGHLGGVFDYFYQPKHDELVLPLLSIKDQNPFNTCVWNSLAMQREVTEGCILSVKSAVTFGKQAGLISGDGFSSLRGGQDVARRFGLCEEDLMPSDPTDWYSYAMRPVSQAQTQNALNHRSDSYFLCDTKGEFLKALDDGYVIQTSLDWYTKYNMSGGLKAPWVLPWKGGIKVGGHAITNFGYHAKKELLYCKTSFGNSWGDKIQGLGGTFYIRFQDFFKDTPEGYATVDMGGDAWQKFIMNYAGKDVKTKDSPVIYRIIDGKKCPFMSEQAFFRKGGCFNPPTFQVVASSLLNQIPLGNPIV